MILFSSIVDFHLFLPSMGHLSVWGLYLSEHLRLMGEAIHQMMDETKLQVHVLVGFFMLTFKLRLWLFGVSANNGGCFIRVPSFGTS